MSATTSSSPIWPANQRPAASAKIERPTAKPRQIGVRRGDAKAARRGLPRSPPGPAPARRGNAGRSGAIDGGDAPPTRRRCRRAAASTSRDGCRPRRSGAARAPACDVVARHVARRDHLDQELVAGGRAGRLQLAPAGPAALRAGPAGRPDGSSPGTWRRARRASRASRSRAARPASKASGREPGSSTGRATHQPLPVSVGSTSSPKRPSRMTPAPRRAPAAPRRAPSRDQLLEGADAFARRAVARGDLFELHAMVEGQDHQLVPAARAGGGAVQVFQQRVLAQAPRGRAVREEVLQLRPARHRRRAAVARHHQRAAGVGPGAAAQQRLVFQPAAQEARHEGVARAQHVEHFDREARAFAGPLRCWPGWRLRTPRSPSVRA